MAAGERLERHASGRQPAAPEAPGLAAANRFVSGQGAGGGLQPAVRPPSPGAMRRGRQQTKLSSGVAHLRMPNRPGENRGVSERGRSHLSPGPALTARLLEATELVHTRTDRARQSEPPVLKTSRKCERLQDRGGVVELDRRWFGLYCRDGSRAGHRLTGSDKPTSLPATSRRRRPLRADAQEPAPPAADRRGVVYAPGARPEPQEHLADLGQERDKYEQGARAAGLGHETQIGFAGSIFRRATIA